MNKLIVGTKAESKDYVQGLLAGSILICAFFALWLIVLVVLKCLGPKRVGLFSGQVQKTNNSKSMVAENGNNKETEPAQNDEAALPSESESDDDFASARNSMHSESEEANTNAQSDLLLEESAYFSGNESETDGIEHPLEIRKDENTLSSSAAGVEKVKETSPEYPSVEAARNHATTASRLRNVRIALAVSGLLMLIFAILFMGVGVDNLLRAVNDTRDGLGKAIVLTEDAIELIDEFAAAQSSAVESTKAFSADISGFCPAVCMDVTSTDCDLARVPFGGLIRTILSFSSDTIARLLDLPGIRSDLLELADEFSSIEQATRNFEWAFYIALAFAGIVAILDLLMMWGLYLTWRDQVSASRRGGAVMCCRNWVLVPIFGFMVFLTFLFTEVFIIGSTASNDFCAGSPDPKITGFMVENQDKFVSVIFSFAYYYVSGCPEEAFPVEIQEAYDQVAEALRVINQFAGEVASNPEQLQEVCGTTDPTTISATAFALEAQTCVIGSTLASVQDFMTCNNWHPIYSTLTYSAVCYDASEGLYWIAISSFVMVLCAMIMLTLRVGFYEL